jgi:DNA-binding GntR family transcriptional regulator
VTNATGGVQPKRVEIELDRSSPTPLYHQVARELERALVDGRLGRGDYLENELVLAEHWQVSRITLRRSIRELVDAGLLVRRRGVGTQVVNDTLPETRLVSLYEDLIERGLSPTTEVLDLSVVAPEPWVTDELGLPEGTEVVYLERCRYADGQRIAIMRNWIVADVAGELTADELEADGLYRLLRAGGVWPHCVTRRISARVAGPEEAEVLGVEVGAPVLALRSRMQDTSGRRIEVSLQHYDGESYTMEMTIVET